MCDEYRGEEQALDRDDSLPHLTCSSALLCFCPSVGGPVSRRAPKLMLVVLTKHWGRSHHPAGSSSSSSSPKLAFVTLITVQLHFHSLHFHTERLLCYFVFVCFKKTKQRISLWIRRAGLWCRLLVCSAFPQGGGHYFTSFSPCQTVRFCSASETQVCFLVQAVAAENMMNGF